MHRSPCGVKEKKWGWGYMHLKSQHDYHRLKSMKNKAITKRRAAR